MNRSVSKGTSTQGRVLIIAGSDSGGGAGIQGDIKTVTMLGGFAATAVTAVTVQNTRGVFAVHPIPGDIVAQQIDAVLGDIGADAIKTGMLCDGDIVGAVVRTLDALPFLPPLVVDPVMIAKGGAPLLGTDAITAMKSGLFAKAALVTPNIPEAEYLTGITIDDVDKMTRAGEALMTHGTRAVLVKGGHMPGAVIHDVLLTARGREIFTSARIDTPHTHGTGCALASAIACGLAQGIEMTESVRRARDYVHAAICSAPGFGSGHGPLDHAHVLAKVGERFPS